MNRSIPERAAPLHHARVIVRMRNGYGLQSAASPDLLDRRAVQEADAVPEDIPGWGLDKERPLPNTEFGLHREGRQAWFFALDFGLKLSSDIVKGGPLLSFEANVLTLVLTNRASARFVVGVAELGSTGEADEVHRTRPS